MQAQPTIVVVEDDSDAPTSAAGAVAELGVVVKRFSCQRETLEFCKPDMLGCFVLDQHVQGVGGLQLRQRLAAQGCQQPFIFISRCGDVTTAVEAMHQGALDCIPTPFDRQRLLDRVQQAIAQDAATRRLRAERTIVAARARSLSPRETQVLEFVAAGKMTKEIARDLNISCKTVEVHRSNIMRKMRVGSAAELFHLIAMHAVVPLSSRPVDPTPTLVRPPRPSRPIRLPDPDLKPGLGAGLSLPFGVVLSPEWRAPQGDSQAREI